jgi:glyoxylase-like metal-dependent hydrolase (beta-lactamase superfamily II)
MPGLVQLSAHVWMYPPHPDLKQVQPTVGVISAGTQTILFDAGNSPRHGRAVLAAIRAQGLPPPSLVIYSHYHWDHIFAACAYSAPVLAHQRCEFRLREYAARPWGAEYLRRAMVERPSLRWSHTAILRTMDDWDDFRVILPDEVFDESAILLDCGGLTLELEHVGGQHSDDSTILRVHDERVIFLADCFYAPPASVRDKDAALDQAMIARFAAEQMDVYVDGHYGRLSLAAW